MKVGSLVRDAATVAPHGRSAEAYPRRYRNGIEGPSFWVVDAYLPDCFENEVGILLF